MGKRNKAAKPITFWFDFDTEDLLCQMLELGIKDDGREDNPWRVLDRYTRAEREIVIASLTERISDKIIEQCTRFETIARANRVRSHNREVFEQGVKAEWNGQSRFTKVRPFAMWLARKRNVVDKELSEVKQKRQLRAFIMKVRRVITDNPQASPRNLKKV
jgi:hypothetical protein